LSLISQYLTTFIAGFIIGFVNSWQLTLVMVSMTPITAAISSYVGKVSVVVDTIFVIINNNNNNHPIQVMATRTIMEQQFYSVAGRIADESLSCIRTIHALNAQHYEIERCCIK
jgi:ABC-type multidrug transport system fused ATPase/permease subunit